MSGSDGRRQSNTSFSPPLSGPSSTTRQNNSGSNVGSYMGMGGGTAYATFVARNMRQQTQALSGLRSVIQSTRLGAFVATAPFAANTVGGGAHAAIGGIHALFGGVGQSNIGTLFNSPLAQSLASQSINSSANRALGSLEHGFWTQRLRGQGANGFSSAGELFGGAMGSSFFPSVRAGIQSTFSSVRSTFPRMAMRAPGYAGIAGGVGTAIYSAFQHSESPF